MMKWAVLFWATLIMPQVSIADFISLKFNVSDESDKPIRGAKIKIATVRDAINISWLGPIKYRRYEVLTDKNGYAEKTILCHDGDYNLEISAEGYYPCKMFRESCYREVVDAKTGRHDFEMQDQSYNIKLRRTINPIDITVKPRSAWYRYPSAKCKVGFDLKIGDWVSPHGKGEIPDLMIEYFQNASNGVGQCSGKIRLPNGGAYKRKKINSSSYVTEYRADTNAVYVSEYPFQNSMGGSRKIIGIAADDEYLVFRTRIVRDEKGEIVSQNYGKIYGLVRAMGEFSFKGLFFNPTPNDTNIEELR